MSNSPPCDHCYQSTDDINAQVYSGAPALTAQLCVSCFALPDARAAFVAKLRAGAFGSDAHVIWFHKPATGGVQVLRGESSGSGLADFLADRGVRASNTAL